MIIATPAKRAHVIDILEKAFRENKGLNTITRQDNNKKSIKKVIEYSVDYALRRDGIYMSDNCNSVALCYKNNLMKDDYLDFYRRLKLVFTTLSIPKLLSISTHFKFIKEARPKDKNYLYLWYLGANPDDIDRHSTKGLVLEIMQKADEEKLDIYVETTIEKNKCVYERFGFEVYKVWYNKVLNINIWFMKRKLAYA
jgi:hypothetical protein